MGHTKLSVYLSFLLRHQSETLNLHMDKQGYVKVGELIKAINKRSQYSISKEVLDTIVKTNDKGRYAYSAILDSGSSSISSTSSAKISF